MGFIKVEFLGEIIEIEQVNGRLRGHDGSLVKDTKEERIRQATFRYLHEKFGYPNNRIKRGVKVQMGAEVKEADGVIYLDDDLKKPFIVIETKSPDKKSGLFQGESYANALGARYVFWTNGDDNAAYDAESKKEISNIPIAYKVGQLIYGNEIGLEQQPIDSVDRARRIFKKCHDILRDVEKKTNFYAFQIFSRLLYAKIWDEMNTGKEEYYSFQAGAGETPEEVADRIRRLYSEARRREPKIFPEDLGVREDLTLFKIAKILGPINLMETDLEIKGEAFQAFLDSNFRGGLGQYFTPRTIVRAMVEIVDPDHTDKILDPFVGSGGFLVYSLYHVKRKLEKKFSHDLLQRHKFEFAHYNLYGIEVEEHIAQSAISDMLINEDAHAHIYVLDSLAPLKRIEKETGITSSSFDVILTNPPLGTVELRREILDQFELGRGREKQLVHVLSIERCLEFLRNGGVLCTIISEDVLERNKEAVDFIKTNASLKGIISLPLDAFKPYGANSKTNILILEKGVRETKELVFMAEALKVGYDTSGKPIEENDLIPIVNLWKKFKEGEFSDERILSVKPLVFVINREKLGDRIDVKHVYLNFLKDKKQEMIAKWKEKGYKVERLSDLAQPSNNTFKTNPNDKYLFVSVHFDGSISPRNRSWEKEKTKYTELIRLNKDDIILSRIDLVDGAVSVVPKELDGAVCSKEFIVLKTKEGVNPFYLWLILRTDYVKAFVKGKMTGVTGRHRIKWEDIKDLEVPVPHTSSKVVEELKTYAECKEKATQHLHKAVEEISSLGSLEID